MRAAHGASGAASQLFTVEIAHSAPAVTVQSFSGGTIQLLVAGDNGANYEIDSTTNPIDRASAFTTNSAGTPFNWSDPATNLATFCRIMLEP